MMNADPHRPQVAIDPYKPAEMAVLIEAGGVAKVALDIGKTLALAILAGAFIALGALFSTVAATQTQLGYGPTRILSGASFSLGLVLVLEGGAGQITWTGFLWQNLLLVTIGNVVGGSLMVGFTYWFIYLRKSRHKSQPVHRFRWRRGNRVHPSAKPGGDTPR